MFSRSRNCVIFLKYLLFISYFVSISSFNGNELKKNVRNIHALEKYFKYIDLDKWLQGNKGQNSLNLHSKRDDLGLKAFGKKHKILVKRIYPHGYRNPGSEYDSKLGYKPLVTLHQHPPRSIEDQDNDRTDSIQDERNSDERTPNPEDATLENALALVQSLRRLLRKQKTLKRSSLFKVNKNFDVSSAKYALRLVRLLKSAFGEDISLYDALKNLSRILKQGRMNQGLSGEDDLQIHLHEHEWLDDPTKQKQKDPVIPPTYSFWDYWTYGKPLYTDDCPDQQVKINNVCINTPPH